MQALIFTRQGPNGFLHRFFHRILLLVTLFCLVFLFYHFLHFFGGHFLHQVLNKRMCGIDNDIILVRHLSVEGHTLLMSRHLFHAAHKLVLREEDRQRILRYGLKLHVIVEFVLLGQHGIECLAQSLFLLLCIGVFGSILFADDVLDDIAIRAYEAQSAFLF